MRRERERTAHHEAGHFIVHASIGVPGDPYLTLVGRDESNLGSYHPGGYSLNSGLMAVWVLMAGDAAEAALAPEMYDQMDAWDDSGGDIERAAKELVKLTGRDDVDEFDRQRRLVFRLVRRRWRHIERVAARLLASPTGDLGRDDLSEWLDAKMPTPREYLRELDRLTTRTEGEDAA